MESNGLAVEGNEARGVVLEHAVARPELKLGVPLSHLFYKHPDEFNVSSLELPKGLPRRYGELVSCALCNAPGTEHRTRYSPEARYSDGFEKGKLYAMTITER